MYDTVSLILLNSGWFTLLPTALLLIRAALTPAVAFAYLALAALEYERVRGELLRRCVFPAQPLAT